MIAQDDFLDPPFVRLIVAKLPLGGRLTTAAGLYRRRLAAHDRRRQYQRFRIPTERPRKQNIRGQLRDANRDAEQKADKRVFHDYPACGICSVRYIETSVARSSDSECAPSNVLHSTRDAIRNLGIGAFGCRLRMAIRGQSQPSPRLARE